MKNGYGFENGTFVIEDYANKAPFCDFLPGIAGLRGRPVWAFFINRGQGIAGFGVRDKKRSIMEFSPAENAYANAPRQGFRTFVKIGAECFEPFAVCGDLPARMEVKRRGFAIEEERANVYKIRAEYFGVPSRDYAALARIVTYTNRAQDDQRIELIDGLAQLLPYGISNSDFKETGNLLKSWMCAEGAEQGYGFYRMRSSTADSSAVEEIRGGNFCVSVCDRGALKTVVDPKLVFGEERTRTRAVAFERNGIPQTALDEQNTENEYPCAFANGSFTLGAGESLTLVHLIGYAEDRAQVEALKQTFSVEEAFRMMDEAESIVGQIVRCAETETAFPLFDDYVRQSCFDNVLRGGMPVTLGNEVYYVYSRKHGDPERDYNFFSVEPQAYSCGNGNFRDVVQNRRNDVYLFPESGDFNIRYFFSLLQADGYNPLSVLGVKYTFKDEKQTPARLAGFNGAFTVGELCNALNSAEACDIAETLALCEPVYEAAFGEGYWTDHFVYLVDLIVSYLAIYPERRDELLFETQYRYFASGARVLPRAEKTVLLANGKVRRYGAVEHAGKDGWLKTPSGEDFTTTLCAKLLGLIAVKTATLDFAGAGIDMEAEKPGWNDATNGLPALFGSNVADLLELKRLILTVKGWLSDCSPDVAWSKEQSDFFRALTALLREDPSAEAYYEKSNALKEEYRARIYAGLSGTYAKESVQSVLAFLSLAESRVSRGLERAKELGGGWYPTYLDYEVTQYEPITEQGALKHNAAGLPCVRVIKAAPHALPHFAEAVAKGLMLGERELYDRAKRSSLYDSELGVYRSSEPLDGEPMEIGRIRSFPKGWLERESCFLHMDYKLMLSLLQAGLYDAFYEEIKTNFVPFQDPSVYGRSTLENCSFLPTSNHCDKSKRGRGFQARLTGANAEVLSMWRIMTGAERPFTYEDGALRFALNPVLHGSFFKEDGTVRFTLLGKTKVTYLNPACKNTYEGRIARYRLINQDGVIERETVTGALAEEVRGEKFETIEVDIV